MNSFEDGPLTKETGTESGEDDIEEAAQQWIKLAKFTFKIYRNFLDKCATDYDIDKTVHSRFRDPICDDIAREQ
ncbi:hypothetical protein NECAME_14306 [Necator americanus]|uniref:Uncharacterized protein n=1 Tax=Necator americanus TaxID=51031 RepID=W2SNQ7_NECAM|nr:hypothetical protein NECAME_14306 [Necator americanus]ETN71265.1 hypothetical protein NECAME_14306 [Necator americanus]